MSENSQYESTVELNHMEKELSCDYIHTYIQTNIYTYAPIHMYTGQMLAASWGEPEVHHYAVVKHSACRLTVSALHIVNRI